MSTVPIFSPDGSLGDIPAGQLGAAVKAGAKPGVHIVAPDGSPGVLPADRMMDAVKAGAKLVPIQDQPIQHPGFWVTLGSDLGGMAKGAWHAAVDPLTDTHEDLVRKLGAEQAAQTAAENSPERQAHGAFYRNVSVPAAEFAGVNVPGMEQSAAEGDVGGVMGHAAAPAVVAAGSEAAVRGAPVAADAVERGIKAAGKLTPKQIAQAAGGVSGGVAGHAGTLRAAGAYYGAKTGGMMAEGVLGKTRANAPLITPKAPVEVPTPAAEDFEGITSPQTEAAGTQSEAEPEPEKAAAAAAAPLQPTKPAPDTSPKSVQSQINDALGGRPLVRGVSLKNQPSAQATAAGKLPEGYTPVNSTLLKGYKYDPAAQEFSAILQDGQSYTHGNVNPDQVAAFEGANSKGNGWTKAIKQGPGTVLVRKNGRPVIKPMPREAVAESPEQTPEQPSTDDLMKQLQDSLAVLRAKRAAKSQ